jgi:hypothetical protein
MAGEGRCPVRLIPWLARSCLAAVTVGGAVIAFESGNADRQAGAVMRKCRHRHH